jgi:glycosyltransferase involved in cell wall biosynthesis
VVRDKGIDVLIEAARLLRDRGHTDFVVDIYGQVNDPSFQALINRLGLPGRVTLQGSRPQAELARLYDGYDVFAFPTWEREPFAFAPLEAAARGCVPLLSQLCGNSEWFVHGVHCLKVDRTAEAFAGALADVLAGRVDLGPLGRRASAVLWRDFHLDALLPRVEGALAAAAGQSRQGAGTAAEAYRLARLAEKLTRVLLQESACA